MFEQQTDSIINIINVLWSNCNFVYFLVFAIEMEGVDCFARIIPYYINFNVPSLVTWIISFDAPSTFLFAYQRLYLSPKRWSLSAQPTN